MPRRDQDYEITYVVRRRTNAKPEQHAKVIERFEFELRLQFGSTIAIRHTNTCITARRPVVKS